MIVPISSDYLKQKVDASPSLYHYGKIKTENPNDLREMIKLEVLATGVNHNHADKGHLLVF